MGICMSTTIDVQFGQFEFFEFWWQHVANRIRKGFIRSFSRTDNTMGLKGGNADYYRDIVAMVVCRDR